MTNNHVLSKNDLLLNKIIKFSINNESIHYKILIDESRKIYTNENYDITIIELKNYDKIDKNSFFDIDNQIFKEQPNDFRNSQIFLIHYPKGNKVSYSPGVIKLICEDNYTIQHLCDTSGGSSGGPIINSLNFQVIGIHKGGAEGAKNYNVGTFLKEPIKNFYEENDNNQNNNKRENNNYKNGNEVKN